MAPAPEGRRRAARPPGKFSAKGGVGTGLSCSTKSGQDRPARPQLPFPPLARRSLPSGPCGLRGPFIWDASLQLDGFFGRRGSAQKPASSTRHPPPILTYSVSSVSHVCVGGDPPPFHSRMGLLVRTKRMAVALALPLRPRLRPSIVRLRHSDLLSRVTRPGRCPSVVRSPPRGSSAARTC